METVTDLSQPFVSPILMASWTEQIGSLLVFLPFSLNVSWITKPDILCLDSKQHFSYSIQCASFDCIYIKNISLNFQHEILSANP